MKFKRKIRLAFTLIFTSIILLFTVSSCNLNWFYNPNSGKLVALGENPEVNFTEEDKKEIDDLKEYLDTALDNESASIYTIASKFNSLSKKLYMLQSYYILDVVIDRREQTEESKNNRNDMYSLLIETRKFVLDYYKRAYNSSHRDEFFSGWTKEEIDKALNYSNSEKYDELQLKREELESRADAMSLDELYVSGADMYKEYIGIIKDLAKEKGFNSALEYEYDGYGRSFTSEDAKNITEYASKYIKTAYTNAQTELNKLYNSMNLDEKSKVKSIVQQTSAEDSEKMFNTFLNYADFVGGDFKVTYDNMIETNSCYTYKDSNSSEGAFTAYLLYYEMPVMYLGYGYASALTLSHEFGHYFSMSQIKSAMNDLDLAETQSQTDEVLFVSYLDNQNIMESEKVEKYLKLYDIFDSFSGIMCGLFINEFETEVYSLDSYDNVDFDEIARVISEKIFPESMNFNYKRYWRIVEFSDPFYYISYAVSGIASINSYLAIEDDYDLALENYLKLCKSDGDFLNTLQDNNFISPFTEAAYQNVDRIVNMLIADIKAL